MLGYLSNLFWEELEYKIINGYRSAISAYLENAEGISIGQHLEVCQLLSGVFNKRPPQTKYTVVWGISRVIDYIVLYNYIILFSKLFYKYLS